VSVTVEINTESTVPPITYSQPYSLWTYVSVVNRDDSGQRRHSGQWYHRAIHGLPRSPRNLFVQRPLTVTECNRSRLASGKFPFALILAGTIAALWRHLRKS